MFDIHITGNSLDEIADKALALGNRLSGTATTEKPAAKSKADKPKAEKPAEQEPAAEETKVETTEPEAQTELPVTLDFHLHVTKALVDAVGRAGKPAAAAVLEQFGVARLSDVPEEQWAEVIAALNDIGS